MRLEIVIRVTEEKVVVEMPKRGWRKEYANLVALTNEKVIISIGQSLEEIQEINRRENANITDDSLTFHPVYEPGNFNSEITTQSFFYFVLCAHQETRPFFFSAMDKIDLKIWLLGNYLTSVGDIHDRFELVLQQILKLHTLTINGQVVGWPNWQRRLAAGFEGYQMGMAMFGFLLPVSRLIPWVNTVSEKYLGIWTPYWEITGVILFFTGFILFIVIGWMLVGIVLMFLYRLFIPKKLFLIHLASFPPKSFKSGRRFVTNLAERLLVDEPIFSPKTS